MATGELIVIAELSKVNVNNWISYRYSYVPDKCPGSCLFLSVESSMWRDGNKVALPAQKPGVEAASD